MTDQHLYGILFGLKCLSFFFAFYITFQFICKLFLKVIEALGLIYYKKSWEIEITGSYMVGIPLLWGIFYFLCTVKG